MIRSLGAIDQIVASFKRSRILQSKKIIVIALSITVAIIILSSVSIWAFSYGPMASTEAESGTASGGATIVSNSNASGGQSLRFGAAAPTCDMSATPANFSSQIAAATNGQTICLANGNYGTWTGTDKAITVIAASGASPVMNVDFNNGDSDFILDGMTGMWGSIVNGANNITIRNSDFSSALVLDNLVNSNILLDSNNHDNQSRSSVCDDWSARVNLPYSSATSSGVTIQNSSFDGGDRDGVQTSAPVTIRDNVFANIREDEGPGDCSHSDPIQGVGAIGVVVEGNLIYDSSDGIVDFDESSGWTIRNNACYDLDRGSCISLYSDDGSIVEHNTAKPPMYVLELDKKVEHNNGSGTVYRNNVGPVTIANSTLAINTHNLFSGASSPNINGTPIFAGGANPTTWSGFLLANGSPGYLAATDGESVGIYEP